MSSVQKPLVVFFNEIDKHDTPLVGGKGANLGEMYQAGFPVPPGFAITVQAYINFLEENSLNQEITKILKETDLKDSNSLQKASNKIQNLIMKGKISPEIKMAIFKAYRKLSGRFRNVLVAARSSATAEDLPSASFAGQQATFLNIKGDANLLLKTKECWASLFTARAIFYREENKISHDKVYISVIVQKMIASEVSGVMFSIDPVTNDKDRIIIESVWGLGETIVQGSVVPDTYVVQKDTFQILSKEISDQSIQLKKVGSKNVEINVPKKLKDVQKITDQDIITLAHISDKLQSHYYHPQDTEWAKEKGKLYIVQTRPVTTVGEVRKITEVKENFKTSLNPILSGAAASPGIASGEVNILKSPKEISKIKQGDILVAPMTSPDYVPAMKKAAAIITDKGGLTSHAAIVSRELGVPCIVGTKTATQTLKNGMSITVDAFKGLIYQGANIKKEEIPSQKPIISKRHIKTATHLYVNLAEPERAKEISKRNVDGVGLLRAEFMIANIGIHPKEAIKQKTQSKFIDKLAGNLETFCKAFNPRPIVYRATDFKTNEYRSLPRGQNWEPKEENPLLGYRGAFRYISSPDVFNLELQAIKKVREKYKNLQLMIPFVRSPEELQRVKRIIASQDLLKSPNFKLLMMVELPVNVIKLEDFIKVGIDGVSIGSNDLTMLLTGTDRDNAEVAQAFNERSPVVLWALKRTIRLCNKHNITSSICGQAPSTYEDLVEKLVKWGITSISVNPDAIERTRVVIANQEKNLVS